MTTASFMKSAAKSRENASSVFSDNAGQSRLQSTRDKLHRAMQKGIQLENDICKAGPRLQQIAKRIPALEVALEPLRSHRKIFDDLPNDVDKAAGPASAVLKVFDAMHNLEPSLLDDPQHDLIGYISLVSRLEEAVRFLSQNCSMAIEWLQEFADFLEQNEILEDAPMKRIFSHLKLLQQCQASDDWAKLDGGLHEACLERLGREFQRILSHRCFLVHDLSSRISGDTGCSEQRPLPKQVLKSLHLILQKLTSNVRSHSCMEIYVETRVYAFTESMKSLPIHYLQMVARSPVDWKSVGTYIGPWTQHMEIVIKGLCEREYHICSQVFGKLAFEDWEGSFAKIVLGGGVLELLQFGELAVRSPNEPPKLFKLLDMFEAMTNLRSTIARLFAGPGCKDVQQRMKDLQKLSVQGAHDILMELKQQIENQRSLNASIDGSLPKVISFVLGYIKHLVGDFYGPIMTRVLGIYQSWKDNAHEKTNIDNLLSKAVLEVMNALLVNVNAWATNFKDDAVLYRLFLYNNFWYLAVNCQMSGLKALVGENWIKEQQQHAELHITMYMKEGWGKLVHILNIPGVMTLTGSRAAARDLLKTKLRAFNAAFEDLYQKHVMWVIVDAELREKIGGKVMKLVVPPYRTYLQNYGPLLEHDGTKSEHVRYSPQSLERILGSLFQGRSERILTGSDKKMNGSSAIAQPATVSVMAQPATVSVV